MQLLDSLENIVKNICTLHEQLAFLRGEELDAEMTAYLSCQEPSLEAKKRAGKYSSAHITKQLWIAEAELQSLIEQKYYLIRREATNAD